MGRSSLVSFNIYTGTAATDTYSYTFHVILAADLEITKEIIATGVISTLVITTDYTVTAVDIVAGSTIVLVAGNLPTTEKITIRRKVALTQISDIKNQGSFFPENHEDEFDKRNDLAQQQQRELDLTPKLPQTVDLTAFDSSLPVPVANNAWRVNSLGTAIENFTLVSSGSLTIPAGLAFMVQTDASVFTARTLIAGTDMTITNGDGQSGNPTITNALTAKLALTTSGNGASLIGIFDTAGNFAATNLETALAEIIADYALTTSGNGASKIGIQDSAGDITGTTVETALAEIAAKGIVIKEVAELSFTRTMDTTGNQSLAHGRTGTPLLLYGISADTGDEGGGGFGTCAKVSGAATFAQVHMSRNASGTGISGAFANALLGYHITAGGASDALGTVTAIDATNITINWARNGSSTNSVDYKVIVIV